MVPGILIAWCHSPGGLKSVLRSGVCISSFVKWTSRTQGWDFSCCLKSPVHSSGMGSVLFWL